MKVKRSLLVLGLIVLGALVVSGGLPLLTSIANTDGMSFYNKGFAGNSIAAGAHEDVFDSPDYVTSFTSDGVSEKIVIVPEFWFYGFPVGDGPVGAYLDSYWFKITFEGNGPVTVDWYGAHSTGAQFTSPKAYPSGAAPTAKAWYTMAPSIIKLIGPCTGKMHIELWAHHGWLDTSLLIPLVKSADDVMATDEAQLQSGIGSVSVPTYTEEGQKMDLKVTAEHSHSDTNGGAGPGGWTLLLFDNNGVRKQSWDIADGVSGYTVSYLVPVGSFDTTPGSNNNWKVELWNNLFITHQEYTVVIKQGTAGIIPPPPTITSDMGKPPYPAGSSLEWLVTGKQNPSGYPLSGFRVSVQFSTSAGQLGAFVMENQWFDANAGSDGTSWYCHVQFTAPQIGYYVISAQSVDIQNNPSVFAKLKFETGPPGIEPPGAPSTDYTMLILGAFMILIAFVLYLKAPIPKPYNLVIALVLVAAAIYLMYPTLQTVFGG